MSRGEVGPVIPKVLTDPDCEESREQRLQWEAAVRRRLDYYREQGIYDDSQDRDLETRLRHFTLVEFSRLARAAVEAGSPDYALRVLERTARITGLNAPDVSIAVGMGSAESLPNLSHLPDEEIHRLLGTPAIETTATAVTPAAKVVEDVGDDVARSTSGRRRGRKARNAE